jgi:hypothetical protein
MRTVTKRINKLENRFGIAAAKRPCTAVVISLAGWELALNTKGAFRSSVIPGSCHTALSSSVNLCDIPDGLTTEELEKFLRKRGAEICGSGRGVRAVGNGSPLTAQDECRKTLSVAMRITTSHDR